MNLASEVYQESFSYSVVKMWMFNLAAVLNTAGKGIAGTAAPLQVR
jgi:hypothetical protein